MIIDPIISKNVALIKDANGKDIERIYDKYGNLVFKNWNTLEGPFPIECFTSSNKLRNYRIYGNTIQDGTPTPENPVEVQGCGEYDAELNGYKIPVTVSNDTNSVTTPVYVGSEPLHKIGDYADYIDFKRGVVVRRIKKLVLTGKEDYSRHAYTTYLKLPYTIFVETGTEIPSTKATKYMKCSHFRVINTNTPTTSLRYGMCSYGTGRRSSSNFGRVLIGMDSSSADDFDSMKNFIAAQYAAGTPVTLWYVLAEPEEEVLPLSQKIPTNIGSNTFSCTISPAPSKAMIQYKKK